MTEEYINEVRLMQSFLSAERKIRKTAEDELTRLRLINAELLEACQAFRAIRFNREWSWEQVMDVEEMMDKAITNATPTPRSQDDE